MADVRRSRVLIADAVDSDRRSVAQILRADGHEVIEIDDLSRIIAAVAGHKPDLIVLGLDAHGVARVDVCSRLRGNESAQHLPILVLTADEDGDAAERAFLAGATDFASKPVRAATFRQRIHFLLRAERVLESLRRSEMRLVTAQAIAHLGLWELDEQDDSIVVSPEADRVLGGSGVETRLDTQAFIARFRLEDRPGIEDMIGAVRAGESDRRFDCRLLVPPGGERAIHLETRRVSTDETTSSVLLGTIQDVTDRVETERRIRFLAHYDALTALPNRALFQDTMTADLARARRTGHTLAVLLVDLDNFKRFNDSLGLSQGDALLQEVARRLRGIIRSEDRIGRIDEDGGFVARLGGDEFIVSLSDLRRAEDAALVARRVLRGLEAPMRIGASEVAVSASIGISLFPKDGETVDELLRNADAALSHAKDSGRHNFQFYDSSMNASAFQRLALEADLRRAIDADEFLLHYQPQVRSTDGKIVGVEALLRWYRSDLGYIEPARFIPIAEDTGMIQEIERWVLWEASRQAGEWISRGFGPIRVAVNLSSHRFRHRQPLERLDNALARTGIPADILELEITEGALMEAAEETVAILETIKSRGVRISVDDFGTGYSSLSYLSRFPIDALKIDRSFVRDLATDPRDAAIVSAIIALSHRLDLDVVAEGVEDAHQRDYLTAQGCDLMQGYFFGKPIPAAEIESQLAVADSLGAGAVGDMKPRAGGDNTRSR